MTFKPAKRASPWSKTTLMTWPWRAVPKSFKAKSDRMAQPAGIISDPGKPALTEDAIEGDRGQHRQEEEQAAEFGPERRGLKVELPDIGDIGRGRPRAGWTFVVGPAWQASESFVLEDLCDGDRTEGVSLVGQIAADVVDREVLFAQGDDAIAEGIGLGCGLGSLGRCEEEVASGILAELMDEDAEAARGVTEAASGLGAGKAIDEEGAEGLVLTVGGVGGLEEDPGEVR